MLYNNFFRMNKINISTGTDLCRDIEQICRNRLSTQTISNVKSFNLFCFCF